MSRYTRAVSEAGETFACAHCGATVGIPETGTQQRNHCPHCLWSRHVDLTTGDRRSGCRGMMEPIGVWVRPDGEWAVIHRCTACGLVRTNRIAADDDEVRLFALAARPLTSMPFPPRVVFEVLEQTAAARTGSRP